MSGRIAYAAGAATFALAVWQLIVTLSGAPPFILPGPARVAEALWQNRSLIGEHAVVTFAEVLAGLVLGSVLGAQTAVMLAYCKFLRRLMLPLLVFSQAVPVFAIAPVLTLWLGYGIASKILMTVLIIYFPVTSAFFDGLNRVNPGYIDLARTMGANHGRILRFIRIPAALPALASGLRLASVYAPIGAVIGEWVGASKGLGYLMLLANGRAKVDLMFAALFVLAAFTVLLYMAVGAGARRVERYASGQSRQIEH